MIRDATIDDFAAYVRLFPELGVDDPLPTRERFGAELAPRALVLEDAGAVTGFALYDLLDGAGYVRNLISDPARRRTGIGRALMQAMRARFVAAGATAWHLNVKPTNAAAIALYEACGLARAHRAHVMRVARGVALAEPLAIVDIPADHDADLEPRFRLLPGQLASARPREGRRPIAFVDAAGDIKGVGVFMGRIPGAFPFRLADPRDAAAAIAALRPLADDAAAPWIQVAAEDDEPLRDAIAALGATPHLEIQHMIGAL